MYALNITKLVNLDRYAYTKNLQQSEIAHIKIIYQNIYYWTSFVEMINHTMINLIINLKLKIKNII